MSALHLTDDVADEPQWDLASCREHPGAATALWFSDRIPDIAAAKAVCATCPLAAPCLAGALARREPWGVWGGQLLADGKVLAHKRPRGRPPKVRTDADAGAALSA